MSNAIATVQAALQHAMAIRPPVGGFPYLAEALRRAGVLHNRWTLPAAQSLYLTTAGPVVVQGEPLVNGFAEIPPFDQTALITALRTDQAGKSSFSEFLAAAWQAGVVRYDVDLVARTVTYYGSNDEAYREVYPAVAIEER